MWQLIKVQQTDWIQDNSGYYTLINWIDDNNVRLDVMDKDNIPIMSFQGEAKNVRKYFMQWCVSDPSEISLEHAAYIGAELARYELLKKDYQQD